MSKPPIPAVMAAPGEFFLAAETVAVGDRFVVDYSLYEIVSEPRWLGQGWMARVTVVEGYRPGVEFNALLRTGRRVDNG